MFTVGFFGAVIASKCSSIHDNISGISSIDKAQLGSVVKLTEPGS